MSDGPLVSRRTALALGLAATLPFEARADGPQRGGVLTAIHWPEPGILNGALNAGFAAAGISTKVFEGLLEYDRKGKPVPQLATSWSVSPDGLTVTFHLRPNVTWHDGKDFTADDVKFSLEVWKRYHSRGRLIYANVTQVDTPDPLTVVLHLSQPAPAMMSSLNAFTSPVMSRHAYEGQDIPTAPANQHPIGTGPWVFKEWQRGSYIMLDRNPNYWQPGRPYPDRMVVRYLPDAAARSAVLENGEVLLGIQTPIALNDVKRVAALPNLGTTTDGYEYFAPIVTMQFNNKRPPFDDVRVRKAIAYAMNRELIVRNVWFGLGKVATGPISSKSAYYTGDVEKYPYDPKKAEALLDEAGHQKDANGVRLKLAYDISALGSEYLRLGEVLKQQLGRIGVQIELRSEDNASDMRRLYTDYDFDFFTAYVGTYADPQLAVYWSKNIIKGVPFSNASGYTNPEMDQLLERVQVENDPARRLQEFHQIQQIAMRDFPIFPLLELDQLTIFNKKVHDHTTTFDGPFSNLASIWISQS
ncbi:MAG TPA: ABC transporter substrate-binding protein [Alphaproteobacteria bacterium]|nr:ABC transporter substrate-binding protein [Alphaproteobacteria bacterium]